MGSDHTSGPLRQAFQFLFGPVSDGRWDHIHHYIRKSGHFLGYGLVGLSWLRAWWRVFTKKNFFVCASLAVLGTFLIASADEFHQTFLPNRTGLFRDVLLDSAGALILILLDYLVLFLFRRPVLASHAELRRG